MLTKDTDDENPKDKSNSNYCNDNYNNGDE